jgi:hypothetical protein
LPVLIVNYKKDNIFFICEERRVLVFTRSLDEQIPTLERTSKKKEDRSPLRRKVSDPLLINDNYKKYGLSVEEACDVLDEMDSGFFFTAKNYTPETIEETFPIIRKLFFFPPLCIWLNGKSYKIAGDYREIDYFNDSNIIRTETPHAHKVIYW